jgi:putative ABC transport system permease protein
VDLLSIHFLFVALGVVIVTCGSAYLSCGKSLKFAPAALMRPKSPAAGHRILLEHISPFWKRLSFSGKIVARNLFRYKSRMAMGLTGIIGSTALILCGFGIMTSIGAMIDKSFADIIKYDAEVKLKAPLSVAETAELLKGIKGVERKHFV